MNFEWLDELDKIELDEETKKFIEVEEKYKELFDGIVDYNSALCDDFELLTKELEECIKTKTPYHVLFKDDSDNKNIYI